MEVRKAGSKHFVLGGGWEKPHIYTFNAVKTEHHRTSADITEPLLLQ